MFTLSLILLKTHKKSHTHFSNCELWILLHFVAKTTKRKMIRMNVSKNLTKIPIFCMEFQHNRPSEKLTYHYLAFYWFLGQFWLCCQTEQTWEFYTQLALNKIEKTINTLIGWVNLFISIDQSNWMEKVPQN